MSETGIDWKLIKKGCPQCGNKDIQWHTKTVWCLRCGFAKNWKKSD